MAYNHKPFFSKTSIQGKGQDELSYVFSNGPIEHKNGSATIFGIFAIHSSQELYQYFIKQTVKFFVDFYNRAASLDDNESEQVAAMNNDEFLFENAIQYVYDKVTTSLIEFQENNKRLGSLDLKKIHCILGVLSEGTLYLCSTGWNLRSFYIYPLTNKQGFSRHSITTIIDSERGSEHQTRLFPQIVSGAVSLPGGVVCIATTSLLDYLSIEQVKQLVTTQQPEDIAASLQKMLARVNTRNDITALFIHPTYTGNAHSHQDHRNQTASNKSMEELNSRQRGTDSVMTPATSLHLLNILKKLTRGINILIHKLIKIERILFQPANIHRIKSYITITLRAVSNTTKKIISIILGLRNITTSKSVQSFKSSHVSFLKNTASKLANVLKASRSAFFKLPKSSRIILSLSILFILLFVTSLFTLNAQKKKQQHFASVDSIIQSLTDKSNTAEARIIFENDSAAIPLLQEMQQLIEHIPTPYSEKQSASIAELRLKITSLEQRLSRTITIDAPEHIATLTGMSPDDIVDVSEHAGDILVSTGKNLYIFSPKRTNLTTINIPPLINSSRCANAIKGAVLLCDAEGKHLYRVTADSTAKSIPFSLSSHQGAIDKFQIYNSNLYAYSARSAMIFKHASSGQGFATGIPWVKDLSITLNDVLDFDIDGTIFVLKNGNVLYQYVNGKPRPLPLPTISPALEMVSRIETDQSSPFLFLMEPQRNRIVVLDKKTLQFKTQLFSPTFTALKDIQIHPQSKNLLVINGVDVVGIPFEKMR